MDQVSGNVNQRATDKQEKLMDGSRRFRTASLRPVLAVGLLAAMPLGMGGAAAAQPAPRSTGRPPTSSTLKT